MMQFHSKFSFLLLLCLMHICIEAKGTEHDEPLVTLDMKQTPIRKVLAEITRQTGVTFSYESSLTKHLLPIDITITAQPLSHCLRILFQKLSVEYIQSGKYIILKKKQKNIVISGFIIRITNAALQSLDGTLPIWLSAISSRNIRRLSFIK